MSFRVHALGLLLSLAVSMVITFFITLVEGVGTEVLVTCFTVSFLTIGIISLVLIERVYKREINRIKDLIDIIREKDYGTPRPIRKPVTPIQKAYNEIYNLSEGKQKEVEDLKQMADFRKEFIADVSHELKTPIFAAQGFVHTLLDGAIGDKKVREKFLKKAARSLDRLDILVQDLVTLSQIEIGEVKMFFEYFDALKICEEVVEQFEEKAGKKRITMKIEADRKNQYLVYADWHRIYQVLNNLIANAIEYTYKKGEVTISLEAAKKNVRISVSDTGVGIAAQHLPRIFERFYRVDKSRSRAGGGTGLGLAIVKHIIEAHNSTIKVESTEGQGTTFSFTLSKG